MFHRKHKPVLARIVIEQKRIVLMLETILSPRERLERGNWDVDSLKQISFGIYDISSIHVTMFYKIP